LSQLATGYTATKYLAEFRSVDPDRAGRLLSLCSIVAHCMAVLAGAGLLLGAPLIAGSILNAPELTAALRFAGIAVSFYVVNGFQAGALAGLEAYPLLARSAVITGICFIVAAVSLAAVGGVTAAAAGLSVGAGIQYVVQRILLARECARQRVLPSVAGVWKERPVLFRFAVPAALSGFITLPALWACNAMLARSEGSFGELALYAAANNFRVLVVFLPTVFTSASNSLLNNQRGIGDDRRYSAVFRANIGLVAAAALLIATISALGGPVFLKLFGSEFSIAYPVLLVLVAAAVMEAVSGAGYLIIQSHARIWLSLIAIALPRDLLMVGLALWLIPLYGAIGLAIAVAAGAAFALASTMLITLRLGFGIAPRNVRHTTAQTGIA
jgi:O-antigen/teichoic acid export membrane protein